MGEIGFPSLSQGASVEVYEFSVATEEVRAEPNRLCVAMESPRRGGERVECHKLYVIMEKPWRGE